MLCPPPPVTPHGSFNCSSSVNHRLGDTCKLTCRTGYRPLLHTITCLSDSTWSDSTFCVDSTPPVIECPVGHTIALLPNETGTNITWPKVTATDFPSGAAIPVTLTSSIGPGSNVTVGAYTVTYAAVDEAGNRAEPCSFLVIVSNSCPMGSFLSVTKRQCRACPVGAYKQHKDSLGCVPCPDGFSTSSEGSSSPTSCRDFLYISFQAYVEPEVFHQKALNPAPYAPWGHIKACLEVKSVTLVLKGRQLKKALKICKIVVHHLPERSCHVSAPD
ncbi:sushi repeat-containing protein SRPX2-like [Haliotis cracherodii]|uniref:sushi repeat-containing protein SRPX2-like n=1 Tax=Haliotis cracherodii TaxID=6455 RepID=UPI0039EAEA96